MPWKSPMYLLLIVAAVVVAPLVVILNNGGLRLALALIVLAGTGVLIIAMMWSSKVPPKFHIESLDARSHPQTMSDARKLKAKSKPKPSAAWLRLFAAVVFTAIPAISLPLFISHLYDVRPNVTDVRAGFVQPHFRDGIGHYFSHADENLIRWLSIWLMAAIILLILVAGQMMRRRLKQMLRPPPLPEPEPEEAQRDLAVTDETVKPG